LFLLSGMIRASTMCKAVCIEMAISSIVQYFRYDTFAFFVTSTCYFVTYSFQQNCTQSALSKCGFKISVSVWVSNKQWHICDRNKPKLLINETNKIERIWTNILLTVFNNCDIPFMMHKFLNSKYFL
jgi:hypothetical protein